MGIIISLSLLILCYVGFCYFDQPEKSGAELFRILAMIIVLLTIIANINDIFNFCINIIHKIMMYLKF